MEAKQFKTIKVSHLQIARKMRTQNSCDGIICGVCPFNNSNIANEIHVACFISRFSAKEIQFEMDDYLEMATKYIETNGEKNA